MNRVKSSVPSRARHKKVLKQASGHYGLRSRSYSVARSSVIKALSYNYRDRRQRRRNFRSLWICRINGFLRLYYKMSYSFFIHQLKMANISLNRKMLADMAVFDQDALHKVVKLSSTKQSIDL